MALELGNIDDEICLGQRRQGGHLPVDCRLPILHYLLAAVKVQLHARLPGSILHSRCRINSLQHALVIRPAWAFGQHCLCPQRDHPPGHRRNDGRMRYRALLGPTLMHQIRLDRHLHARPNPLL